MEDNFSISRKKVWMLIVLLISTIGIILISGTLVVYVFFDEVTFGVVMIGIAVGLGVGTTYLNLLHVFYRKWKKREEDRWL